uniref:Uncharacterized protein n=1 Tax=Pithovirus LCPAC404 TaxID=2506597 RepID=A0A481ZEN7_9VIRU|nr:MAG: hypothetical protein LCPAC404_03860 [Pithovirus LCPAC404]
MTTKTRIMKNNVNTTVYVFTDTGQDISKTLFPTGWIMVPKRISIPSYVSSDALSEQTFQIEMVLKLSANYDVKGNIGVVFYDGNPIEIADDYAVCKSSKIWIGNNSIVFSEQARNIFLGKAPMDSNNNYFLHNTKGFIYHAKELNIETNDYGKTNVKHSNYGWFILDYLEIFDLVIHAMMINMT